MKVFDVNNILIENYDLQKGKLLEKSINVVHVWVIDKEKESHYEVITEYPNGGKDVAEIVDAEEQGHWETYDENNNIITEFDGIIPDDTPRELQIPNIWKYQQYVEYTEDELLEIQIQKEKAEQEEQARIEYEEKLNNIVDTQEDTNNDVMDAITELGDLVDENDSSSIDLMDAVTELGDLVAAQADIIQLLQEELANLREGN